MTSVLLADDDDDLRALVGAVLRPPTWSLTIVASGNAALEALRSAHFDLLVVDQGMPRLSGTEVARLARAQGFDGRIVVWSAHVSTIDPTALADVGATCLDKAQVTRLPAAITSLVG